MPKLIFIISMSLLSSFALAMEDGKNNLELMEKLSIAKKGKFVFYNDIDSLVYIYIDSQWRTARFEKRLVETQTFPFMLKVAPKYFEYSQIAVNDTALVRTCTIKFRKYMIDEPGCYRLGIENKKLILCKAAWLFWKEKIIPEIKG